MRHLFSLVCQGSAIDQATNNFSIFNIVHQIVGRGEKRETDEAGDSEPVGLPFPCHLITVWQLESNEESFLGEQLMEFVSPEGNLLAHATLGIDLRGHQQYRNRIFMEVIPFTTSGEYTFRIYHKSNDADEWTLSDTVPLRLQVEFADTSETEEPA